MLVYERAADTMPSRTLCEGEEMCSVEQIARGGTLVIGFPEMSPVVYDSIFKASKRVVLHRGGADDEHLRDYLITCYHNMEYERRHAHRRVKLIIHTPVSDMSQPVVLSIGTDCRLSWIYEQAVQVYQLDPVWQDRVQLRYLRGTGSLPEHGPIRQVGYSPKLKVELYMKGLYGGGKRAFRESSEALLYSPHVPGTFIWKFCLGIHQGLIRDPGTNWGRLGNPGTNWADYGTPGASRNRYVVWDVGCCYLFAGRVRPGGLRW
jgi:hypothetical protein